MKFGRFLNRDKEKSASRPPRNGDVQTAPRGDQRRSSKLLNTGAGALPQPGQTTKLQLQKGEGGHLRIVEKGSEEPWPLDFIETGNCRTTTQSSDGISNLPPLQVSNEEEASARGLAPLREEAVDLDSFDLAPPPQADREKPEKYSLERRSFYMFSMTHLRIIFQDFRLLRKFTAFLVEYRPESVPLLVYHLDARKAMAALRYSNAVRDCLRPVESLAFTRAATPKSTNKELRRKAEASFAMLAHEDLPAWITAVWMRAVEISIRRRINGSLPSQLRDMSEGLAETFVLSDPSRHDNPILFASEEFCRMTQYGLKHVIGRNCRIFQGPGSDTHGVRRVREKLGNAQQHYEPILNYRRDGTPFMNLLMITPLLDSNGRVRYYLGAQIDTSGLLQDFYGFEYLSAHFNNGAYIDDSDGEGDSSPWKDEDAPQDELRALAELLQHDELEIVRQHGGRLHHPDLQEPSTTWKKKQRLVLLPENNGVGGAGGGGDAMRVGLEGDILARWETNGEHYGGSGRSYGIYSDRIMKPRSDRFGSLSDLGQQASHPQSSFAAQHGGHLGGVYDHYLLVRPAPHLRILFASPSLRIPGMVQSNLMDRIGGSAQLRQQVEQALYQGQSVTAKVKWNASSPPSHNNNNKKKKGVAPSSSDGPLVQEASSSSDGSIPHVVNRNRWIHATPLLGRNSEVGVWMVVLVDEEKDGGGGGGGRGIGGQNGSSRVPSATTSIPVANGSSMRSVNGPARPTATGGAAASLRSGRSSLHETDGGSAVTVLSGKFPPDAERDPATDGLRPPPSRGTVKRFGVVAD